MQFYIVLVCLLLSAVNFSQQHFNSDDDQCHLWQERNNATGDCECGNPLLRIVVRLSRKNIKLTALCVLLYDLQS